MEIEIQKGVYLCYVHIMVEMSWHKPKEIINIRGVYNVHVLGGTEAIEIILMV